MCAVMKTLCDWWLSSCASGRQQSKGAVNQLGSSAVRPHIPSAHFSPIHRKRYLPLPFPLCFQPSLNTFEFLNAAQDCPSSCFLGARHLKSLLLAETILVVHDAHQTSEKSKNVVPSSPKPVTISPTRMAVPTTRNWKLSCLQYPGSLEL